MPTRPTLAHVAHHAGVSLASASRALNGASASENMISRVREAAVALGYVADATARSLKVGRTEQLALAVADLGNPVYVSMMRAVERTVRAAGYRLVLSSTGADTAEELAILHSLGHGYADGLILSPLRITDELTAALANTPVPVVVIGNIPAKLPVDNVRANSPRGVALAIDHLKSTGRRRIAFVNGPLDTVPGSARARGYAAAIDAAELPLDPRLQVLAAEFTHEAGETAAADLPDNRYDAVLCANDLLAVGVMRALGKKRLSVPHDIAVVGMDDTELAELCTPTLTSVNLGSERRGQLAAQLLLDRLADRERPPRRSAVQPKLVVRESSARRQAKSRR